MLKALKVHKKREKSGLWTRHFKTTVSTNMSLVVYQTN